MLTSIDLFAGIGGIALGLAPWAKPVAYVEKDPFCCAVLKRNMKRERLPTASIFADVRTFNAAAFRGKADLVTAGFPCQDISRVGTGAGLAGERSRLVWQVLSVAKESGCAAVFLENVSAITLPGLGGAAIVNALARMGMRRRGGKLVVDEFAHHAQGDELWRAAQAVATWGHSIRVLSTHNGKGCRFYSNGGRR